MSDLNHVLFLASWYPNRLNPTLGNFNQKFAEAAALYNKVTAIHVVADPNLTIDSEILFSEINGVQTYTCYFKKKKNESFWDKIIKSKRYYKYYKKLLLLVTRKHGKPDIVHLNVLYPVGIIVFLFKIFYKLNYVISENWTGYLPENKVKQGFFARFISKRIAKSASMLLPVTENLKNAMINKGLRCDKFSVVPNVVDIKYFFLPDVTARDGKKVVLHVSSLKDEHKNITGIINVIEKLALKRSDFELVIVGDGDAKPHIAYAQNKGLLDSYITFFGEMTPEEVGNMMRKSDLLVLFSNYENLPCVIVEAFASGLPVVSTTVGGIAEHLSPDKGILISPKDEKALIEALDYMLSHLHDYSKEQLHAYADEKFSYQSVGKRFTEIYNSIIQK